VSPNCLKKYLLHCVGEQNHTRLNRMPHQQEPELKKILSAFCYPICTNMLYIRTDMLKYNAFFEVIQYIFACQNGRIGAELFQSRGK